MNQRFFSKGQSAVLFSWCELRG